MTIVLLDRPVPIDDATRRQVLIGGASLAALLASCTSTDPTPEPPAASTGFPVTIRHTFGSTEITQEPKRVVSVGYNDQDPIVALGVIPVGVADWWGDENATGFSWTRKRYGDTKPELVGLFYELSFEKVAALHPEVIIGVSGMDKDTFETFSKIAPTVPPPAGPEGRFVPWQEIQLMIGQALGRENRAKELIADVEGRIAAARAAHPEFAGRTVVFLEYSGDMIRARGTNEVWTQFLTSLGFTVPPEIVGAEYKEMSLEELGALNDLDVLVSPSYVDEQLADNPLYQRLALAREGRGVFLDGSDDILGAIAFNSALSLPILLDELVPQLAAAIDGDPGTTPPP